MKRITRTIESTRVTVVFADIKTKTFDEKTLDIIGTFEAEKECLAKVERDGNLVPIAISESKRIVKRYAIDVETFVKYAKEISVNDEEDDESDTEEG